MALEYGYITIGWRDSEGVETSTNLPVNIDNAQTLADILLDVDQIVTAAEALSECGLNDCKVTIVPAGVSHTTPVADSDANEGLLINYSVNGSFYPADVWIAGMIDALLVNKKIDLTNSALTTFTAKYTALTRVFGTNKSSLVITALRDAAQSFRKLGRVATKESRSRA